MNPARFSRIFRPLVQWRSFSGLADPTWSVRTLLPSSPASVLEQIPTVSASTISHLLRLSALPPPADPASLHNHLHFVRELQNVPTEGVVPLAAIRDEIDTSRNEYSYKDILEAEAKLDTEGVGDAGRIEWDPMSLAKRQEGGMYAVDEAVTEELVKPELEGKERNAGTGE